jgi:hypothetical protein
MSAGAEAWSPRIAVALAAALSLGGAAPAHAAYFTRITDPANPIVSDAKETGGSAWADLDGDGRPEAFVAHGNLTNQIDALYWNAGALGFARLVGGPIATDGGPSIGATWGDYDNDGRLDLFVTNRSFFGNFRYHALGDTTFERVVTGPVATDLKDSNSSSWVDIDRDGDLDLFVVNFGAVDDAYRNEGPPGYAFTPVDTGLVLGAGEFSIPGAWCDYDDDGDADLFVGHAGNQNDDLYTQVAPWSFVRTTLADARNTLGASWGDVDNDGDLDLFTASFINQASLLYLNAGSPTWALTAAAGTPFPANPGNAVGSAWGDFDNDGDLDLFVNRDGQNNLLFVNDGPPAYALARADTFGVSLDGGQGFGSSWVDADADGDLDLFVANRTNQSDFLYRNDGATGHWLELRLAGTVSNRAAIGARVRVRAIVGGSPRWQTRDVEAQSGYNSQTLGLHVGLGDAAVVDSVVVRWPSGVVQTWTALAADSAYVLVEDATPVGVEPGAGGGATGLAGPRLRFAGANPFAGGATLEFELARAGAIALDLVDVRGARVRRLGAGPWAAGTHRLLWDGSDDAGRPAATGVYFARLVVDGGGIACAKTVKLR